MEIIGRSHHMLISACVLVSFLSSILSLLRSLQKSVIAAAEMCFDVTPSAMESAAHASTLFRIMVPGGVEQRLEFTAEL